MVSTSRRRLALCRKVSAQAPDLMYDRATGTMVRRDAVASISDGEAIWPIAWPDSPAPSEKSPEQGPGHAPAGSGEA